MSLLVFLNKGLKFQTYACNRCHNLLMMPVNLSNIPTLRTKDNDHRSVTSKISKKEVIKLFQVINLTEKKN